MAQSANPFYAYNHANETRNHSDQIIMLYCMAISYMQQAKDAAEKNDHDARYKLVEKTLSIMRGLRACLDFSANLNVATALNNYYEALDELLVSLQIEDNKLEICDQIITNLKMVKAAWEKINVFNLPDDEEDDFFPPDELDYTPKDLLV